MKLSIFVLCVCIGVTYATGSYSQSTVLSLDVRNQTVQDVLDKIEAQTEFRFFYNNKQVDISRQVSLKAQNENVFLVLDELFKETDVAYKVIDRSIILSQEELIAGAIKQQNILNITGKITDQYGDPVIGANILQAGSTNGTITDLDGRFKLAVPANSTLIITYIGYLTQEVAVGNKTVFNIQLKEDAKTLDEVVVTALGIKREEKALGYAVQRVSGDKLPLAKTVDVATGLTGKIAGLNIQNSTEFNQEPNILLRGQTPLIIVDGIPYENVGINAVAADDIESIDVLKGATASALYGAKGSTGAIMITTKKGTKEEGLNIQINSNTMFFSGYLAFPEVQSGYSRGYGGKYNDDYVWGDKLDIGRTALQWDPYTYEWREQELTSKGKNNFKNFLQFSMVTNNNVNISQKGKYGSFRASLTHVYDRGQFPNQDLNKFTFLVGGEMSWGKFKMDASASYNKRKSSNENGVGKYSSSYIYDMVIWGGSEYDVREYRDYWIKGKEGVMQNWYDKSWYDNPWFKAYEVVDAYDVDLMNAMLNGTYEVTPWLKAMVRGGLDFYSKRNEWRNAISANQAWDKKGFYGVSRNSEFSINTDAMLMADKTWGKFNLNVLAGGNIYYFFNDNMRSTTAGGLSIPEFYSLNASIDPVKASSGLWRKQANSLYGKASLSWASTYFLDITGRNDWVSTLRKDERSYFYPSVSGSIILSEILKLPDWWDFLKARGSWTATKQAAGIYANNNVYSVSTNKWDGMTAAYSPSSLIGGIVRPKKSTMWEVGLATHLFSNRLYVDLAYYRKIESDFIIEGGVSDATGYSSVQTNFKEKRQRTGFEVTVGGTPIKTRDFSWDILTNWGHDKYEYLEIDPEYSTKKPWVKKGENWNWIAVYDWERDPQGNIIHNGGIPVRQEFQTKVGNTTPDLVWGISNTLRYKQFTLDFSIDGRIGGISYSRTHQMLWNTGAHIKSDNIYRYDEVVNGKQTFIGQGVKVVSGSVEYDTDGKILKDTREFAPNDVVVSYEAYISKYHDAHNRPARQNYLRETFFKIRNLSLTYELPASFCRKLSMKNAYVGFTAQNLFYWGRDYKYADPDKGGDSSGHENLNSPSQRYMGFNVKVNF
ncbi:SusC/RagA family TonB-linked outer membrane protein [Bacteroides sp. 519]|uniref:SusC/RagA family TonB-linked outer membrane protein n=1 Tax=Bacteroides sp. 519 TaxID=2302937 RepID=UPI0019402D9E|nr:SusC/RagA family TonB-linked outer membrane protein [Bacteroides sp. 519]